MLQGVRAVYRGLQGNHSGYRELEGFKGGYYGLQKVTGRYKEYSIVQRVTVGYKGLRGGYKEFHGG